MYLLVIERIALRLENQLHYHSLQLSREQAVQCVTPRFRIKTKRAPRYLKGTKPILQNIRMPLIFQSSSPKGCILHQLLTAFKFSIFKGSQRQTPTIWKRSLSPNLIYSIDIFNKEKSHEKVIASNGCLYFGKWYYLGSPQKLTVVIKMNGDEGKEHQVGNAI